MYFFLYIIVPAKKKKKKKKNTSLKIYNCMKQKTKCINSFAPGYITSPMVCYNIVQRAENSLDVW